MPVAEVSVSLFEVLEVRGAPLTEPEIWGIAYQSALTLHNTLAQGEGHEGRPNFVICPDTLTFTSGGEVQFPHTGGTEGHAYAAPELRQIPDSEGVDTEKVHSFSLGKTLRYAAEYGLIGNQPAKVSSNLGAVLKSLCEGLPSQRPSMIELLEACDMYADKYTEKRSHRQCIRGLYKTILGSGSEEDTVPQPQSKSRQTSSFQRENRANRSRGKHKYSHRREQQRSKSRSRSRSRSRHRSGNEETDSGYQPSSRNTHRDVNGVHIQDTENVYTGPEQIAPPPYKLASRMDLKLDLTESSQEGQSYHLSDITFSSSQNGGSVSPGVTTGQRIGPLLSPRGRHLGASHMGNTAYEKYLRIKERQKKLKVLRRGLLGEGSDEDSPITLSERVDHLADTRSISSAVSYNQEAERDNTGAYLPGLHMQYGSEMALRVGRDSDRESIVSSEFSSYQQDFPLRSTDQGHHSLPERGAKAKVRVPHTNSSPRKPREYYGPEFVHKASKPIIRVPIPLQGESLKNPSHARRVVIVLLTGQKLEAMCDPSTTGQQLFESVITHIELPEFFFFGLTYVSDGEHFFVDPEMKLHKVAPEGWKEGWKGNLPTITFTLYLRVKFYPDNILLFRHQISRHLLYLQLRHDLLEERTMCNEDKALTLSALALQVEYGDYDHDTMGRNYFMAEHYYPQRIVKRVGVGYIRDNTPDFHQRAAGLGETKGELEFIKIAQQLPEYGVHFYKLLKNKNDTTSVLWMGITVKCMVLAENQGLQRAIDQQYAWNMVQKISFNKRRFSIQPKPDHGQGKPTKMNYYTNSYRKGRYLLQFSTMQHRFQLKMKAREAQLDAQGSDLSMDTDSTFETQAVDLEEEESPQASFGSEDGHSVVVAMTTDRQPIPYSLPPPYRADTSVSMMDLREKYALPVHKRRGPAHAASTGDILEEIHREGPQDAHVLGMTTQSVDLVDESVLNETISATLQHRLNSSEVSPEQPDRHIFEVVLGKDPNTGFGITIVGGESTSKLDLGIFVKSVTHGGPAHGDGRIRPGDRIIAINDQSLEGRQHHTAVQMIRESGSQVKLLISQVKCPGSLRRKEHDDPIIREKLRLSNSNPYDVKLYSQLSHYSDNYLPGTEEEVTELPVEAAVNPINHHHHSSSDQLVLNSVSNIPLNSESRYRNPRTVNSSSHVDSIQSEVVPERHVDHSKQKYGEVRSRTDSDLGVTKEAVIPNSKPMTHRQGQQRTTSTSSVNSDDFQPGDVYEVFLEKKDGSFGLNVTGGVNTSVRQGGIYVKSLIPGSAAETEGCIKRGDRILSVDGESLVGKTHKQAVETLCHAPPISKLVMERGHFPTAKGVSKSNRSSPAPQPLQSSNSSKGSRAKSVPVDVMQSSTTMLASGGSNKVRKGSSSRSSPLATAGNVGSHVREGRNSSTRTATQDKEDRRLRKGSSSRLSPQSVQYSGANPSRKGSSSRSSPLTTTEDGEVNLPRKSSSSRSLPKTVSNTVVTPAARTSKKSMDLTISEVRPPRASPTSSKTDDKGATGLQGTEGAQNYSFDTEENQFTVDLERGRSGLGFSVQNARDLYPTPNASDNFLCIKKVFPIGPAAESGRIKSGDVILEVNDRPVKGLSLPATLATLRAASAHVTLLMCRPDQRPLGAVTENLQAKEPSPLPKPATSRAVPSPYETESEGEQDRGSMITPPSGFASPRDIDEEVESVEGPPPPLPVSPPPTMEGTDIWSLADETESQQSLEVSTTLSEEEEEEFQEEGERSLEGERSPSPDSQGSEGSDNSIVRSPLKDTRLPDQDLGATQTTFSSTEYDAHSERSGSVSPRQPTSRSEEFQSLRVSQNSLQEEESESEEEEDDIVLQPGEFEVMLRKAEGKGLGFTVTGGAGRTGGCYIKGILQNPALSDGRLRPGDKLIKVNDIEVAEMNHFEAVTYLRQAPQLVKLKVYRPQLPRADNSEKSGGENISHHNMGESDTESFSQGEAVKKTDALFSFLEGQDKNLDEQDSESEEETPRYLGSKDRDLRRALSDIPETSDAAQSSGECSTSEYSDSQNAVQQAVTKGRGVSPLERPASVEELEGNVSLFSDVGLMKVEFEKPRGIDLGISLVTAEKDNQTGVFIRSIAEGSLAQQDGRLCVMDRLVQVNGESLVGLTHTKAVAMLKKAEGRVTLTVSRVPSRHLELMTPPVIMEDDDINTLKSESEYRAREVNPDEPITYTESDREGSVYDSEEDDMQALVYEAEKLLAAEETIELKHNELKEDRSEAMSQSTRQKKSCPDSELSETNSRNEASVNKTFLIEPKARNIDIEVPQLITNEWLSCLPLLLVTEEHADNVTGLIPQLQRKIEHDDPMEEYKELRLVKMTDNCAVGRLPENKSRNRFRNVLPYDQNRVELSSDNDYTNASHIILSVENTECHYIACQGPLPNTSEDFWQMVWEQAVSVITMLTQDVESRKVKCHRYWPDSVETPLFVCDSQYKVSLKSFQSTEHLDVRHIQIENVTTRESRDLHHINYITWPDHGVPDSALPILQKTIEANQNPYKYCMGTYQVKVSAKQADFVNTTDLDMIPIITQCMQLGHAYHTTGPLVVHCSAGIGRTGAFITIDMALAQIEHSCSCDIFEIVKELRRQRPGMIQTKDQYMLCYCACIEALLSQTS